MIKAIRALGISEKVLPDREINRAIPRMLEVFRGFVQDGVLNNEEFWVDVYAHYSCCLESVHKFVGMGFHGKSRKPISNYINVKENERGEAVDFHGVREEILANVLHGNPKEILEDLEAVIRGESPQHLCKEDLNA